MPGMSELPGAVLKHLPPSRFPGRDDLPQLSAQEARALLKELRRHQINGLLTLDRGPTSRAPYHRRYFGQRSSWFIEIHWPAGTQRMTLDAWAQAWLVEDARRERRAMLTHHRP